MPLSPLQKHIYNHGSEEVIRKGKKIYLTKGVELLSADSQMRKVDFRVKNDVFNYQYAVKINHFDDPKRISIRCQCPYNMGMLCRHEVAALMELNDMVESGYFSDEEIVYDQSATTIRMKNIDLNTLRMLTANSLFKDAEALSKRNKIKITLSKNDRVEAYAQIDGKKIELSVHRLDAQMFETSCTCDEKRFPICEHKVALFLLLLNTHGSLYFDTIKDPNKLRNKLLARYGYSMDTPDWESKFEFKEENGRTFLKVLDPSLKPINNNSFAPSAVAHAAVKKKKVDKFKKRSGNFGLGVLFTELDQYPYFGISLISGDMDEKRERFVDQLDYLDIHNKSFLHTYTKEEEKKLIKLSKKLTENSLVNYISKSANLGDFIDLSTLAKIDKNLEKQEQVMLTKEYMIPKLKPYFELISKHHIPTLLLPKKKKLLAQNTQPVEICAQPIAGKLHAEVDKKKINIDFVLSDGEQKIKYSPDIPEKVIHREVNKLFLVENQALDYDFISGLPQKIAFEEWPAYAYENLSTRKQVQLDPALIQEVTRIEPSFGVKFTDNEQTLKIQPLFYYSNSEAEWNNDETLLTYHPEDGVLQIKRDKAIEQEFIENLRGLHHNYVSNQQPYFSIRKKDVLKKSWFFKLYDFLIQNDTKIIGLESLQNYKISTLKPETNINVSSGADWFDTKIQVKYGEEVISLKKIKRALLKGDSHVKLKNGQLALLPEEWLQKYSMIVKMGDEQDDKIKLSKLNFSLLENIQDEIDDYEILKDLESKKQRLINYDFSGHQEDLALPDMNGNPLREYQKEGFHWLSYLSRIGWGGILADDMGLGKTLQTLTLLKYYKEENPNAKFMIITPTSLMFNWQNEIEKFAPDFNFITHHGSKRAKNVQKLVKEHDIVMTSYGTIRSDAELFEKVEFDYIVLDESQNIKNPLAIVAKSVMQLKGKNKICLSGTPLQNNTFDIYSQMNFLNPGMLGSIEFFKKDIANPIDKQQDSDAKKHLHKILYPFILRRTKEQVAPDLPEKTETVLYVEMEEEQRKVYDQFRNFYRDQILSDIRQQGFNKSKFTILQGLTKLRQICNSPSILKDKVEFEDQAAKIKSLGNQMEAILPDHKALIFSQFLGMLDLIRKDFDKRGIKYAYFDGSTTTAERQKMIDKFQNDPECQTFLISLRAGGVGLNLTAADYVYIVDPWWNPAIEQQAIDRTHRIGQDKNIFAYRMITKDTIEEKILSLQEKKKSLVKEVIGDDSGFVKQLKEEDIMYLFS